MFNPISILSTTGNIATKLYGFYNLTTDDVKNGLYEAATAKNIAYATLAVTAAGSVIAYPPTRMALCTFLSLSYTMSTITLQLIIMGLYFMLAGTQGLTSAAGSLTSLLSDLRAPTKGDVKPPVANLSQLAAEARQLDTAWSETQTQPAANQALGDANSNTGAQPQMTGPVRNGVEFTDEFLDDFLRDMEAQERQIAPQAVAPKAVNDDWSKIIEESPVLNPKNWVEEYAEGAAANVAATPKPWAAEFMPESRPVLGAVTKHATVASQWVREYQSEEMVAEFLNTQKKSGGLGKKLLIGAAAGVAVYSAWQLYKTIKEAQTLTKDEFETTGSSYGNVDSDALYVDYNVFSFASDFRIV